MGSIDPSVNTSELNDDIVACHDCDLLLRDKKLERHRRALCPRCGAVLHISRDNSMVRTLALSLAGLLLFIPANILPILTLEMLGQSNVSTSVQGIVVMTYEGYWWMGFIVAFCSIVAPLLKLLLLTGISTGYLLHWKGALLSSWTKWYQHLNEWGMFDVYMLGILVSYIKLRNDGDLIPGVGLLCFIALLLVVSGCASAFDAQQVWAKVDQSKAVKA